jgi:hypothetical protein
MDLDSSSSAAQVPSGPRDLAGAVRSPVRQDRACDRRGALQIAIENGLRERCSNACYSACPVTSARVHRLWSRLVEYGRFERTPAALADPSTPAGSTLPPCSLRLARRLVPFGHSLRLRATARSRYRRRGAPGHVVGTVVPARGALGRRVRSRQQGLTLDAARATHGRRRTNALASGPSSA